MSEVNQYADSIVNKLTIESDVSLLVNNKDAVTVEYVNNVTESKMDKTGGIFTGVVELNDYLKIGKKWRINASSDGRRLVFEYCKEGNDVLWRTAVPFIQTS